MTMEKLLQSALSDLRALGVPHAVVGGHAVSARTEPRFTRDLDFAIGVADDNAAEALIRDLS